MPSPLELLFTLFKQGLELLDEPEVLFARGPIVEKGFEFVVLILHEGNAVFVFIDHVVELFFDFLGPFDLVVNQRLELLFVLPLLLFFSVLVLSFEPANLL